MRCFGNCPHALKADAANPDKTGAYGLTLANEAEQVARYEKATPLTQPGDLVLIDFLTLHRSGANVSSRSRWSLQMRWFNFAEPTGKKLGWPGAYAAGGDLRARSVAKGQTRQRAKEGRAQVRRQPLCLAARSSFVNGRLFCKYGRRTS